MAKKKLPRDTNQLAKSIVDLATGEDKPKVVMLEDMTREDLIKLNRALMEEIKMLKMFNEIANNKRALSGQKGGEKRASKLTPEQRTEIAKKGAAKRWGK